MKTILAFSCLLSLLGCGSGKKPEGVPVSYEYRYNATMAYYITWYQVEKDSTGVVRLSYSKDHNPEITVLKAPSDLLEFIGRTAAEYKLHKLKDHYLPPFEVLDGYGWGISIVYPEDSIWSGGSNAWPGGKLAEGINVINSRIQSIIDASTEADILEKKMHR